MRRRKGSGAAAPRHRCHGCQPSSPRPRRSCHCTNSGTHPPPQSGVVSGRRGRGRSTAGEVRWQCAGNEDRQTGGSGRRDRARGTTARRSCRGCSPAREAATTRAAPEAGRRVRGGGQPAEQQRQLQAARQRKRQGGARAAGQSGTREWRERGRTRGTAAGQVGAQGATSQQPR